MESGRKEAVRETRCLPGAAEGASFDAKCARFDEFERRWLFDTSWDEDDAEYVASAVRHHREHGWLLPIFRLLCTPVPEAHVVGIVRDHFTAAEEAALRWSLHAAEGVAVCAVYDPGLSDAVRLVQSSGLSGVGLQHALAYFTVAHRRAYLRNASTVLLAINRFAGQTCGVPTAFPLDVQDRLVARPSAPV